MNYESVEGVLLGGRSGRRHSKRKMPTFFKHEQETLEICLGIPHNFHHMSTKVFNKTEKSSRVAQRRSKYEMSSVQNSTANHSINHPPQVLQCAFSSNGLNC